MKRSNLTLVVAMFCVALPSLGATQVLTPAEWREDLRYLQNVIKTERSNLFHKVTEKEFDAAIQTLDQQIPSMERHEIIVGLTKVVAMFQIGHTSLPLWSRHGQPDNARFHRVPIRLHLFSDGVFVRSADERYRDAVGGRVLQLGEFDIEEALRRVRPVVSAENEQFFRSVVPVYLSCPEILHATGVIKDIKRVAIVFEKDGRKKTIQVEPGESDNFSANFGIATAGSGWVDALDKKLGSTPLWRSNLDRNFDFTYMPENETIYVRHSSVRDESDETIKQFFGRVFDFVDNNDVERFILDLRLNGGGNNYLNKPVITGLVQARKINQRGRLFTIIGRQTFSAAQNLVNEIERYTETIFVGEPTAENVNFFGDTVAKELPNSGLRVLLSHLWWQDMDPRDKREWTEPEIAVDMTFEDYRSGHDPVLEAIYEYTEKGDLADRLRALITEGDIDRAREVAIAYGHNPQNRYQNAEGKVNGLGYSLMNEGQFRPAIETMKLNTTLFPNSANAWDSLAEVLWKSGNIPAAIENYKKALQMDPDGVGANSSRMLEQINAEHESRSRR